MVVEEKIASVGVLVRRMPVPRATGHVRNPGDDDDHVID